MGSNSCRRQKWEINRLNTVRHNCRPAFERNQTMFAYSRRGARVLPTMRANRTVSRECRQQRTFNHRHRCLAFERVTPVPIPCGITLTTGEACKVVASNRVNLA
jgi:hypothetical protein